MPGTAWAHRRGVYSRDALLLLSTPHLHSSTRRPEDAQDLGIFPEYPYPYRGRVATPQSSRPQSFLIETAGALRPRRAPVDAAWANGRQDPAVSPSPTAGLCLNPLQPTRTRPPAPCGALNIRRQTLLIEPSQTGQATLRRTVQDPQSRPRRPDSCRSRASIRSYSQTAYRRMRRY